MRFKKFIYILVLSGFIFSPTVALGAPRLYRIICVNKSETLGVDLGTDIRNCVEYYGEREDDAFQERVENLNCEQDLIIEEGSCSDYVGAITDFGKDRQPLPNPLKGAETPSDLIGIIIKTLVGIVGAVALVFFIMGSTTWLTSAGNPEKVKEGTKTMIFSALGVLLIFLSYMVVSIVLRFLERGSM